MLFEMDARDYAPGGARFSRPSVRGIILRGDRLAMVHSLTYDYYKFPGGGIEPGEGHVETLVREVAEETGLRVRPASIRPYGMVHRIEKGDREDVFEQDNFYYFCETEPEPGPQRLDPEETAQRFALEYVSPEEAAAVNRSYSGKYVRSAEREALVIELLMSEGCL